MSEVNPWSRDDVFLKENGFWDMLADYIGGQIRVIRVNGTLDALFATCTEAQKRTIYVLRQIVGSSMSIGLHPAVVIVQFVVSLVSVVSIIVNCIYVGQASKQASYRSRCTHAYPYIYSTNYIP